MCSRPSKTPAGTCLAIFKRVVGSNQIKPKPIPVLTETHLRLGIHTWLILLSVDLVLVSSSSSKPPLAFLRLLLWQHSFLNSRLTQSRSKWLMVGCINYWWPADNASDGQKWVRLALGMIWQIVCQGIRTVLDRLSWNKNISNHSIIRISHSTRVFHIRLPLPGGLLYSKDIFLKIPGV